FAFGRRAVVLDTNVRRVLARAFDGQALPAPHLGAAERAAAEALLPDDEPTAALTSAALMELGALVCTARTPRCTTCPLAATCAWLAADRPPDPYAQHRRRQPWHGTDRQARGRVMAALRHARGPVPLVDLVWPDPAQLDRCVVALAADGLLVHDKTTATVRLPSS
ncbi:MAG: A/G-specific adenine glycosylase, partial [Micrococcales bacterium]|nr:A/G-specific adenine glycosylase [Micrococcales bacterium]